MGEVFFGSADELGSWLAAHHDTATELVLGFHTVGSGRGGITYSEALDEALCHGWIDGIRRRVDDGSYSVRFTPRTPRSGWSKVNVARVEELDADGRMQPSGLAAFDVRRPADYSNQRDVATLDPAYESRFRADEAAWAFFESQPVGYRRTATFWVMSAKREETRQRRLGTLIDDSANGVRITLLRR